LLQATIPFPVEKTETLNRLEIGAFQQVFMPTEATLKVSILGEDNTKAPLAEASQTLIFSKPACN